MLRMDHIFWLKKDTCLTLPPHLRVYTSPAHPGSTGFLLFTLSMKYLMSFDFHTCFCLRFISERTGRRDKALTSVEPPLCLCLHFYLNRAVLLAYSKEQGKKRLDSKQMTPHSYSRLVLQCHSSAGPRRTGKAMYCWREDWHQA